METHFDIQGLRQKLEWKQERLARYLGVDRSTVSRMESGQRIRGPALRLLEVLQEAAELGAADELCPEAAE
jgi:DNA-binding transcriptional regulator YiaG